LEAFFESESDEDDVDDEDDEDDADDEDDEDDADDEEDSDDEDDASENNEVAIQLGWTSGLAQVAQEKPEIDCELIKTKISDAKCKEAEDKESKKKCIKKVVKGYAEELGIPPKKARKALKQCRPKKEK